MNPVEYHTLAVSHGAVARVRMNRPQVFNAFDEAMIGELDTAFARLADDPQVRVIVLEGAGKAFSAGADLQWMQRASTASFDWNVADAPSRNGGGASTAGPSA